MQFENVKEHLGGYICFKFHDHFDTSIIKKKIESDKWFIQTLIILTKL